MQKNRSLPYIPFEHFHSVGGPASFMKNLKIFLDKHKFSYLPGYRADADFIFFPISFDKAMLNNVKKNGGKIIQRLDGVYYPSKHGEQCRELNSDIKDIYLNYSDFVVFQSEYSKKQCFAMLGEKPDDVCETILNGVNKDIFFPDRRRNKGSRLRLVTTGNFRNVDMIEPVVKALDSLKDKLSFELVVVGPVGSGELERLLEKDYVTRTDAQDLRGVADILRGCDIFLYSHLNPPCPNSVIEAVSCGLPVVGFDSGAMPELLFFGTDLLAHVSDDLFQQYEDFDYRKLAEKIRVAAEGYEHYRDIAMAHATLYSFEDCGKRYVEVFEKVTTAIGLEQTSAGQVLKKRLKERVLDQVIKPYAESHAEQWLLDKDPADLADYLHAVIRKKCETLSPFDALQFLFDIEYRNYRLEGQTSVRYGGGVHTKHWHIKYHDFFVKNIPSGSRVLDVGCGIGALAYDIATKVPDVLVYGIDCEEGNIRICKEKFLQENVIYVHGDALKDLPDDTFDVIVLSNVLEHIEKRVEFLRLLKGKYNPQKILIRVPMFERDWRVPLKKELGIDYRLDKTHYIEYRQEEFFGELEEAGLKASRCEFKWGEIWAVVEGCENAQN